MNATQLRLLATAYGIKNYPDVRQYMKMTIVELLKEIIKDKRVNLHLIGEIE